MIEDPEDVKEWSDLPPAERRAMRRAAQSQIWWAQLGYKIRGLGPLVTAILAVAALFQVFGEAVKDWLNQ